MSPLAFFFQKKNVETLFECVIVFVIVMRNEQNQYKIGRALAPTPLHRSQLERTKHRASKGAGAYEGREPGGRSTVGI